MKDPFLHRQLSFSRVAFDIASTLRDLLTLHCMTFQLWAEPVFFSSQRTVYSNVLPLRVDVRSDKPLEACTSPFFSFNNPLPRLLHLQSR